MARDFDLEKIKAAQRAAAKDQPHQESKPPESGRERWIWMYLRLEGRLSRLDFQNAVLIWLGFGLAIFGLWFVLNLIGFAPLSFLGGVVIMLGCFAMVWSILAMTYKRLKDAGLPLALLILAFVGLIILLLICWFAPSESEG